MAELDKVLSEINKLPKPTNYSSLYLLAQQAFENGFRGMTVNELVVYLSNNLPDELTRSEFIFEEFPPGSTLPDPGRQASIFLGPGTYTTPGGTLELTENFNIVGWDGVNWNKVLAVPIEVIPPENKIKDFVPGETYLGGSNPDQKMWKGQMWSVKSEVVNTTEEPGTGTDWENALPADGLIELNDTKSVSGDTVYRSIAPLTAKIEGGSFTIGDADFSSYTTENTQEYTFLQRLYPVIQNGVVTKLRVFLHRAGDIALYTVKPTGAVQTFEYTAKTVVTGVVGYNEFVVNLPIDKDGMVAVGQLVGGGLLTTKTVTTGIWFDLNPDRNVGVSVSMGNSNRAAAIGFDFEIDGIEDQIQSVDARVDGVQSEVASSMKEPDLTIERSLNMFDPSKIVDDRYISSTGSVATVAGWQLILINIEDLGDGQDITFNGINPSMPSYYGFYTTDDGLEIAAGNLIPGSNGTFSSNPVTVQKPTGAVSFGITIKRPTNTESVYASAVINLGDTPIPYQPYSGDTITKYKEFNFKGGGQAYDQSLNTTDNVQFNAVAVNSFETNVLVAELPEGAGSPPVGVEIGQAWIDTTDDTVKVRRA